MEGPGMSLFAGADSIHLSTSIRRPEEEEAVEDQKRRNQELQNELQNGFDDFVDDEDDDDDESNDNSKFTTANITKSRIDDIRNTSEIDLPYITNRSMTESISADRKLQMMYEVRVREVQRLSEELEKCRRDASTSHDSLYSRLAIANAERERTQFSLQQSQELLANSKHHITELEHKVSTLSNRVDSLQSQNEELNAEVTATAASLTDAQQRLQAVKLNQGSAQTTDALFRAQQDRYKEDTDRLEQDLLKTRNRLMEKENDLSKLEKRYIDMERLKEELLIEKGSTINRLALELEETQNRLANNDSMELMEKISRLTLERNTARLQLKEMGGKLKATATELVETRNNLAKLQEEKLELEFIVNDMANGRESDSFVHMTGSRTGHNFSSHSDKITLLRNELTKSVSAQQLKREQINKLNKSLAKKDDLIKSYKTDEELLKSRIKTLEEREQKLTAELKNVQCQLKSDTSLSNDRISNRWKEHTHLKSEFEDINNIKSTAIQNEKAESLEMSTEKHSKNLTDSDLSKEHNKLNYQLTDAYKQISELTNMYIEASSVKDKLLREIDELKSSDVYKSLEEERANVEELLNQLKIEKLKVDELGNKLLNQQLEDLQTQLKNLKKDNIDSQEFAVSNEEYKKIEKELKMENLKLKKMCEEQSNHLSVLAAELDERKQLITQLNSEIELQGQRETLICDLKAKAKEFEDYIMIHQNKFLNRKNVSTSPIFEDNESKEPKQTEYIDRQKEYLIVEEKIRQDMAQHFALEIKNMEELYSKKISDMDKQFNLNVIQLSDILKVKTKEVETLQELLFSERLKVHEIVSNSQKSKENELIHEKNHKDLLLYQEHVNTLTLEIKKLKYDLENDPVKIELRNKVTATLEELNKFKDKYRTIKKTAAKYKEYIAEKDIHVNSEIDRIKHRYEMSLNKMKDRLNSYVQQVEEQTGVKICKAESKSENDAHLNR